jgi:hypothetical protein
MPPQFTDRSVQSVLFNRPTHDSYSLAPTTSACGPDGPCALARFVAIAILAYELTRSPALVALLAVQRMVP